MWQELIEISMENAIFDLCCCLFTFAKKIFVYAFAIDLYNLYDGIGFSLNCYMGTCYHPFLEGNGKFLGFKFGLLLNE